MRVTQQAQDLLLNIELVALTDTVAGATANTLTATVTNAVRGGPIAGQLVEITILGLNPDGANLTSCALSTGTIVAVDGAVPHGAYKVPTAGVTRFYAETDASGVAAITAVVASNFSVTALARAAAGQASVGWSLHTH
jgi:hypothetical protein